jgi:hypothetical protein
MPERTTRELHSLMRPWPGEFYGADWGRTRRAATRGAKRGCGCVGSDTNTRNDIIASITRASRTTGRSSAQWPCVDNRADDSTASCGINQSKTATNELEHRRAAGASEQSRQDVGRRGRAPWLVLVRARRAQGGAESTTRGQPWRAGTV